VNSLDDRYYYLGYLPSPAVPQIGLTGDSGSAVLTSDNRLYGVLSLGTNDMAMYVRSDRFASWATSVIANP